MRTRVCTFDWTDNSGKPGSNHVCGEPHGHATPHKCASCDATHDNALPLEAAVRLFATGNPAVDRAINALLDLPNDVKPGEVADRAAELLDAIGTPGALDMAKRVRDARGDGDRLMDVLTELELLGDEAARAILDGAVRT